MLSTKLNVLLTRLQKNSWVPQEQITQIKQRLKTEEITEETAFSLLKKIERTPGLNVFHEKIEDEWEALAGIIIDAENRVKRANKFQLYMGLCAIPIFISVIIAFGIFGWFNKDISSSFLIILSVILGAIVSYSFFTMRTMQQGSIAMERLAEKRLAILFIRTVASSGLNNLEPEQLLATGFEMFMRHHAPATLPLSPEDSTISKSK